LIREEIKTASTGREGHAMKRASASEVRAQPNAATRRILVAYFSWSGNTREIANQIHESVGGDLFEIVSVDKYPRDYDETVEQAKKELDAGYMPKLVSDVENVGSYDVVFIGYPNWWGTIPRPVASFLSRCDSPGKIIAPFCTHGGDRLGQSAEDIAKLCTRSTVLEGLAVRGGEVRNAKTRVSEWLRKIGMME
jgi:flavodoxin